LRGTKKIPARALTVAENNKLKNMGVKIKDASGKIYGGGYLDPGRQFKIIEKQAASAIKGWKPEDVTKFNKFMDKIFKKQKVPKSERGFIATALLEDFGKMGLKGGKLLKWLQLEYDVAFESLIYDYHRRYAGHEPGLAREALFLPKILAKYFPDLSKLPFVGGLFEPYEAGIMEGPGEVLEKRLYERKDDEGKVIGENKSVKSYIDNNKRMEEISSKYRNLDDEKSARKLASEQSGDYMTLAHPRLDTIVNEQRRLENEYNQLEKLNSPDSVSGFYDAYQTAKEKQDTEYGVKKIEAHKKRVGQERFEKEREKKLHEEYLDYRGGKERSFYLPKGKLNLRVEDPLFKTPYTFLETKDTPDDIWEPGSEFWDYHGLTGEEGTKEKWKTIYDMGGIDLMDRIGIAGGVSKMAEGGIMSLKKK